MTDSAAIGKLTSQIAAANPLQRPVATSTSKEAEQKASERVDSKKRDSDRDVVETSLTKTGVSADGFQDEFSAVSGPGAKLDLTDESATAEVSGEDLVRRTAEDILSSPAASLAGQALNLDEERVLSLTA